MLVFVRIFDQTDVRPILGKTDLRKMYFTKRLAMNHLPFPDVENFARDIEDHTKPF